MSCPYCKEWQEITEKIIKEYESALKLLREGNELIQQMRPFMPQIPSPEETP